MFRLHVLLDSATLHPGYSLGEKLIHKIGEPVLTDIHQKIQIDFGLRAPFAMQVLDELDAESKGLVSPRLIRALVYLAKGDIEALKKTVELARTDWRDVLLQAEYSYPEAIRVRDFDKTFHELGSLNK